MNLAHVIAAVLAAGSTPSDDARPRVVHFQGQPVALEAEAAPGHAASRKPTPIEYPEQPPLVASRDENGEIRISHRPRGGADRSRDPE